MKRSVIIYFLHLNQEVKEPIFFLINDKVVSFSFLGVFVCDFSFIYKNNCYRTKPFFASEYLLKREIERKTRFCKIEIKMLTMTA